MQIVQVDVIPILAPRKEPVRSATGTDPIAASEFGIVRIIAEDGCEGLGEISITSPRIGFTLCHAARRLIAPRLLGLDPLRLPDVLGVVDATLQGELSAPYLRAATEMALLDLTGQHLRSLTKFHDSRSISAGDGGRKRDSGDIIPGGLWWYHLWRTDAKLGIALDRSEPTPAGPCQCVPDNVEAKNRHQDPLVE